ncbi:hypothetical protein ACWT_1429 [Actinoplanes sp. SE50]|uniref:hypothetical protein n=1 Tax=unclassified Actinoplanes TaxID=2626549 RepID=UPI00023EC217|nr:MULTISPECIES: hypothetical protein [unclassified Actinoplanes]AEV82447.1 hypothetical protein ACPL_1550 [Actinoplanes sp. SE50/110]ATO80844.1 hypothetical protein ACWT_1429 [Actinoplanes sp. SE50]SLL98251.1 hypothetical protein ACSP50_1476 [Actinoplanes sp. SE50/110]
MSDDPSGRSAVAVDHLTSKPVRTFKIKRPMAGFVPVMIAVVAAGPLHAHAGARPEANAPAIAPIPGDPGWQGVVVADVHCGDADPCRRVPTDPALADKSAFWGPDNDTRQLISQVEAALAKDLDKRTACGLDDKACAAKPPSPAGVRQALTAAGISHFEVRTGGLEAGVPEGTVLVGIPHGPGCVIVTVTGYTHDIYKNFAQPDGTCLHA